MPDRYIEHDLRDFVRLSLPPWALSSFRCLTRGTCMTFLDEFSPEILFTCTDENVTALATYLDKRMLHSTDLLMYLVYKLDMQYAM